MSKFSRLLRDLKSCDNMKYSIIELTVRDFLHKWLPNIDCSPIHQRIDVFNYGLEKPKKKDPSKRQGILGSIFKGIDISEIKINQRTAEEKLKYRENYESIDGGNRKRAIQDYYQNKFPINEFFNDDIGRKFFKDLTDEEKERFYKFKMRIVIYQNLTPKLKAIVWETTNNSTPVNHQEMLNGLGDTPVANAVRQLARSDRKLNTSCHTLFNYFTNNEGKIIGEHLTFDPTRLTYDRLVARVMTIVYQGEKPSYCDDEDIENLYSDETIDEAKAKDLTKKTVDCLNFIYRIGQEKKHVTGKGAKLTELEFIALMRLYFTYKDRWTKFEIKDYEEWYRCFQAAYAQFHKKNPSPYGEELIPSYDKNSRELKSRAALFIDNLGKGDTKRWLDGIEWLEKYYLTPDELIGRSLIVVKDTRRSFSREDRELQLAKQKGLCYIDGKPLKLKDAEAAHKTAHTDGGRTDAKNMVMIRAIHNRRMGSITVEEYKDLWLKKNTKELVNG